MSGVSEQFVQEFRRRRLEEDWDLWDYRQWMRSQEARLREENPGLHDYIEGVIAGLAERLEGVSRPFICQRLYFHFLELLAIMREHEQIQQLERLWRD